MHEIDRLFPITRGGVTYRSPIVATPESQGDVATTDLATQRVNRRENWLGYRRACCEGDDAARVRRGETKPEWR
jgi:hypothetical protein